MTTVKVRLGGCLCGEVRFEAQGDPNSVSTCQCRSCRRASGADSVAWVGYPIGAINWLGTQVTTYQSSAGVARTFCPKCGSSLSYQIEVDSVDMVLACLDDPESFSPEKEIWLDHRLSWNVRNPDIPGYRQFRSDGLIAE